MTTTITHILTDEEVVRFHRDGFLGPFAAVSPDEMAGIRRQIDETVLGTPGHNP
jgi:hypothetical protein